MASAHHRAETTPHGDDVSGHTSTNAPFIQLLRRMATGAITTLAPDDVLVFLYRYYTLVHTTFAAAPLTRLRDWPRLWQRSFYDKLRRTIGQSMDENGTKRKNACGPLLDPFYAELVSHVSGGSGANLDTKVEFSHVLHALSSNRMAEWHALYFGGFATEHALPSNLILYVAFMTRLCSIFFGQWATNMPTTSSPHGNDRDADLAYYATLVSPDGPVVEYMMTSIFPSAKSGTSRKSSAHKTISIVQAALTYKRAWSKADEHIRASWRDDTSSSRGEGGRGRKNDNDASVVEVPSASEPTPPSRQQRITADMKRSMRAFNVAKRSGITNLSQRFEVDLNGNIMFTDLAKKQKKQVIEKQARLTRDQVTSVKRERVQTILPSSSPSSSVSPSSSLSVSPAHTKPFMFEVVVPLPRRISTNIDTLPHAATCVSPPFPSSSSVSPPPPDMSPPLPPRTLPQTDMETMELDDSSSSSSSSSSSDNSECGDEVEANATNLLPWVNTTEGCYSWNEWVIDAVDRLLTDNDGGDDSSSSSDRVLVDTPTPLHTDPIHEAEKTKPCMETTATPTRPPSAKINDTTAGVAATAASATVVAVTPTPRMYVRTLSPIAAVDVRTRSTRHAGPSAPPTSSLPRYQPTFAQTTHVGGRATKTLIFRGLPECITVEHMGTIVCWHVHESVSISLFVSSLYGTCARVQCKSQADAGALRLALLGQRFILRQCNSDGGVYANEFPHVFILAQIVYENLQTNANSAPLLPRF